MISLDEQIVRQKSIVEQHEEHDPTTPEEIEGYENDKAIFLSLRRLKRIEELMREPSQNLLETWWKVFQKSAKPTPSETVADAIAAMSAALLKQVEEEMK